MICIECKEDLSTDKFPVNSTGINTGTIYRRNVCKECYNLRQITRKFGLSVAEYRQMEKDQGGCCAICEKPETRTRYGKLLRLCVDHNDETGQNRGLLCSNCNVGIGLLDHEIVRLEKAVNYLLKYERTEREPCNEPL